MSLRRSARAPTTQPATDGRTQANSSASSVSSSRLNHSSRSSQKPVSPHLSPPARSQTPENANDSTPLPPRRTRSNVEEQPDDQKTAANEEDANKEVDEEDEEEETRCVCGQLEYPGLPVTNKSNPKGRSQTDSDPISEDSTGWFIQCDDCQVWQHGGCVGILDENDSPEKYYCELCRKDLHEVGKDLNGRKYSRYLPAQASKSQSPSASPPPKGRETAKRRRDSRLSRTELDNLSKGRRATMNSRDSAYDEAEQLRRAIEESKKDSGVRPSSARKGKRGRSESEERDEEAKRRRTASGSSSSHSKLQRQKQDSDEETPKADKNKNVRGAAARNQRAKDFREREAREKERNDAAKRRSLNTKRKPDGGPWITTISAANRSNQKAVAEMAPEPISRSTSAKVANLLNRPSQNPPSKSHKKGGRPPARKGRLGRNQYSKDRDPPNHSVLSPGSNNSHDGDAGHINGLNSYGGAGDTNGLGKPSRPKHMNPNRTTMNDMKRRVAGILEFISHTQVDMAGLDAAAKSRTSSVKSGNSLLTPPQQQHGADKSGEVGKEGSKGQDMNSVLSGLGEAEAMDEELFGKLNAVEMMEVLTRRLMRWQSTYGKYGEK